MTKLGELLAYELTHSTEACDAFSLEFLFEERYFDLLHAACEISIFHDGAICFVGVIDECKFIATGTYAKIFVSGRGYGAKLLDNEAESAEYWGASTAFVLERHVYPYGIGQISCDEQKIAGRFMVSSGESQWSVLNNFCIFGRGVTPRFDRYGTLLINGEVGETVSLTNPAITAQTIIDARHGVISHVLVKNTSLGTSATSTNDEFIERGGLCWRVVNVPSYTEYDIMRYTGDYQIEQSQLDSLTCKITLPQLAVAFAGDVIVLSDSPLEYSGTFYVTESCSFADAKSAGTILTMRKV